MSGSEVGLDDARCEDDEWHPDDDQQTAKDGRWSEENSALHASVIEDAGQCWRPKDGHHEGEEDRRLRSEDGHGLVVLQDDELVGSGLEFGVFLVL